MSTGKYGIDEIAKTVDDIVEVSTDVKKMRNPESLGGEKIVFPEILNLTVTHAGKAVRLVGAIDDIGKEIADLEAKESPELCAAIEKLYSPSNPYVKSGAEKMVTGILWEKEGIEDLVKAKQWEKDNV